MADLAEVHPQNAEIWMPDFYRRMGFYFTEAGSPEVPLLEPPSSTFPHIPRPILDEIASRVRVIRNDAGTLVEIPPVDPVKSTFYFVTPSGEVDMEELNACKPHVFPTVHTNSYFFKPSIEEIALQVPAEMWGVTKFVQCDRVVETNDAGVPTLEAEWPDHTLVDPSSGKGLRPGRLHLAMSTLFLEA